MELCSLFETRTRCPPDTNNKGSPPDTHVPDGLVLMMIWKQERREYVCHNLKEGCDIQREPRKRLNAQ